MSGTPPIVIEFSAWKLVAAFVFIVLNGFFVAAEFALVKVRSNRMESLARQGNRRAEIVVAMLAKLDMYLSSCQLGITLASLVLGWLAEPAIAALLIKGAASLGLDIAGNTWVHPLGLAIALTVITLLHMILGEQTPKIWSIQKAESTSMMIAIPLHIFTLIFKPMIWLVNRISNRLLKIAGASATNGHQSTYDLAEIRSILDAAAVSGQLTSRQRLFGKNILGLASLEVRHVMVPRVDVVELAASKSLEDNLKIVRKAGHSRFPLTDPDLESVKGFVHSRDILSKMLDGKSPDLQSLVRKCPFVSDTQPLSRFILELQHNQTHCAIVFDEHGTTVGIAFLEDALEEIVGPIHDEFDEESSPIEKPEPGVAEFAGSVALPEAEDVLEMDLEDEADTIGGLIVARLGRIPLKGEQLDIGPYKVTVISISRRRVSRVRFEKKAKVPTDSG